MGREIRRVPPDWEHPRDERGNYIPLYDEDYTIAADGWLAQVMAWERGDDPDREVAARQYGDRYYWDWDGGPPDRDRYRTRAWTAEEATAYQIYETVSEGTPVSPVFASLDALIAWLVDQGHSERAARGFAASGWAPSLSMLVRSDGSRDIASDIEGLDLITREDG
jgi:hypothetical protein